MKRSIYVGRTIRRRGVTVAVSGTTLPVIRGLHRVHRASQPLQSAQDARDE